MMLWRRNFAVTGDVSVNVFSTYFHLIVCGTIKFEFEFIQKIWYKNDIMKNLKKRIVEVKWILK